MLYGGVYMKKYNSYRIVSAIFVLIVCLSYFSKPTAQDSIMVTKAFDIDAIVSLFALQKDDILPMVDCVIKQAQEKIDGLIQIPSSERTFSNTAKVLDELVSISNVTIFQRICEALELLNPDKDMRDVAHDASIKIQQFLIESVATNKRLYNAFMEYAAEQKENEDLSDEQRYFLNDTIDSFKREGLHLSDEQLEKVTLLQNDLFVLSAHFERAIAEDNRVITVTREELQGLSDSFITSLTQTEDGLYTLGVDYPTYFRVMEQCAVEDTRKKLLHAFSNRAYPDNDTALKAIIEKRDQLARMLGYEDFSHYNIDGQMAHSPERVHAFLNNLIERSLIKVAQEKDLLTQDIPQSVMLDQNGRFNPWDFAYVEAYYKKKYAAIDEQKVAEYFSMEKTIEALLDIYRQFLSIEFKEIEDTRLWHPDVRIVQVLSKDGVTLLGTLLLDLYPRSGKYSHAAHTTIIPSTITENGDHIPEVSIVIANFTKSTDTQPSLLKRDEVRTFFHEFGHALHAVLGRTTVASLSGTHTKTDFVELPSQMLEEWLWDKTILKKISSHYITGEALPDEMIDKIISLKNLTSGFWVLRQCYLSKLALACFERGEHKDPHVLTKTMYDITTAAIMGYYPDSHSYASFGHLTGYGAKYYGYLWSKVFALDIFAEIKKHGLLDPVIGQRYIKEIIGKGGAQDPNELLYNFLEREPNSKAFFADMGL